MQIEIEVTGQKIKRLNSPGSVADTLNYLTCHFIFVGEEWDNTVRTAYFNNQKSGERYAQIIADDGTCTVPWEALTDKGFVRFSVAGEREDYRITTDIESFYNGETVYGGEPSEPPTPSQYDQMIALAEQTKEIAESVRMDADEGKFDGDPGEPGKPGAPGKDGVSVTAKVDQTDDGAVITITDATGTTTAELKNGKEGNPGQNATDEQVRTAVEAYMEEHPIQGDTEDIIKLAIKNEASGAVPIAVTDSADMGVQDLTMQGWTEQASTTGAQLFDASKIPSKTQGGATVTNNGDGSFTITGEGRLTIGFLRSTSISGDEARKFLRAGTLRTNMVGKVPQFYVYAQDSDREVLFTTVGTGESELTDEILGAIDRFYYVFFSEQGQVITPGIVWPMVYQDGDGTWEPYTGGQPSPSPDYPQEITNAGKYDEEGQKYEHGLKLTGKNMLPRYDSPSDWMPGGYFYIPIHGFIVGETYTASQQNLPEVGENFYVLIGTCAGNANAGVQHWLYHKSGGNLTKKSVSFKATQEVYYLNVADISGNGVTIDSAKLDKFLELFPDLMLEIGSEPTEYTPHQEQTVLITSDRPLTKWDKLEKRNGQWGWVYKSMEITLDGSKNWCVYAAYEGFLVAYIFDTPRVRAEGFCESFICETAQYTGKDTALWLGVNNYSVYAIRIPQYNEELPDSGLQDWKDYLAENPLTILTCADEETFVPLSESEQSALNALTTYYPTTVLDNDQGCEMSVQYIADTKAYIDKKISAIQAAIVNTI